MFVARPMRRLMVSLVPVVALAACGASLPAALKVNTNGLSLIAPGVYTDAPGKAERLLATMAEGRARSERFHGNSMPDQVVLCTTKACTKQVGLETAGLAYGEQVFLVGPDGLNAAVMGHEFSHVGLRRRLGLKGMTRAGVPVWFDEGLAVYLSPDPRYRRPARVEDAMWITKAQTLRDWKRINSDDTWRDTYGAAGRVVEALAAEIGEDGLQTLIRASAQGQRFDRTLERLRSQR